MRRDRAAIRCQGLWTVVVLGWTVFLGAHAMANDAGAARKSDAKSGAALFEDMRAVPLPKRQYGYRGAMGDLVELKDGRLLLAYSVDNGIGGRISKDKGKTWGDEFQVLPRPAPKGKDYYCHPTFQRLKSGQLLLAYIYVGKTTPPYYGGTYFRRSVDEGKTWSDQYILTPEPGYNIMHNDKLTQLSAGRIVAPLEHELKSDPGGHRGYVSFVFYSDDNGYSWHRSKNDVNTLPVEAQEPQVVELKDGRLLMLCRTYSGFVVRSHSDDKGETWSKGEPVKELTLSKNSSAINVKRIASTGDLLLLRCTGTGTGKYRTPFVSAISKDDGKTWTHEREIAGEPDNDYGYPSLTFVDDMALISYHKRDGIYVARIGVDWFYGK